MSIFAKLFGGRAKRSADRAERVRAQAAEDDARRNQAQFEEDNQAQEQGLQQNLANRGLGMDSSVATQGMQAFQNRSARQRAALASGLGVATANRRAGAAQRTLGRSVFLNTLSFLDDAANMYSAAGLSGSLSGKEGGF